MKCKLLKTFSQTLLLILLIVIPLQGLAFNKYPPFYIYKVNPEQSFVNYMLIDITGKIWESNARRHCVFITGSWRLRYDIRKWAKFLNNKYGNTIDILWIYNPASTQFVDQYDRGKRQLTDFSMPIPAIIDNHSFIGRALKIDYNIPTIVGVTSKNILAFVHAAPLNKLSEQQVMNYINLKFRR